MRITKRELILSLHAAERTVPEIARALECHPAYVENVLAAACLPPDPMTLLVKQRDALLEACRAAYPALEALLLHAEQSGLLEGWNTAKTSAIVDLLHVTLLDIDHPVPDPSPDDGPTDADCDRWAAQEEADGRRIQEDIQDAANRRDALAGEFLPPQSDPSVSYETPSEVGK